MMENLSLSEHIRLNMDLLERVFRIKPDFSRKVDQNFNQIYDILTNSYGFYEVTDVHSYPENKKIMSTLNDIVKSNPTMGYTKVVLLRSDELCQSSSEFARLFSELNRNFEPKSLNLIKGKNISFYRFISEDMNSGKKYRSEVAIEVNNLQKNNFLSFVNDITPGTLGLFVTVDPGFSTSDHPTVVE